MCLYLKNDKKIVAKSDITCYKVVKDWDDMLVTYFQCSQIEIGKTYDSYLKLEMCFDRGGYDFEVNYGIHSFTNLREVKKFVNLKSQRRKQIKIVVVKCVIPKGSSYYRGIFSSNRYDYKSIASNSIKYCEEIMRVNPVFPNITRTAKPLGVSNV